MEQVMIDEKLIFKSSSVKPARISNLCYKNDKFRKVRMTYFDAGENVQVFFQLALKFINNYVCKCKFEFCSKI
jgi:hypothetical protein